jgi:hypothetical protein
MAKKREDENSLKLVLEVLEGQGVLQNGGIVRSVARHGPLVNGVGSGHGHGAHGGGEGEQRSGQHYDLVIGWWLECKSVRYEVLDEYSFNPHRPILYTRELVLRRVVGELPSDPTLNRTMLRRQGR